MVTASLDKAPGIDTARVADVSTPEDRDMLVRLAVKHQLASDLERQVRDELRQAVTRACDNGMSEYEAAQLAGVQRRTIRSWRGKDAD